MVPKSQIRQARQPSQALASLRRDFQSRAGRIEAEAPGRGDRLAASPAMQEFLARRKKSALGAEELAENTGGPAGKTSSC